MKRLCSWKEIAEHLGKTVRTAQRWEKRLQLPIHRPKPGSRLVWAFPEELDAWIRRGSHRLAQMRQTHQPPTIRAAALRVTLDLLPVPAYVFDQEREFFIAANRQFSDLIGYSEPELIQLDWRRIFVKRVVRLANNAMASDIPRVPTVWRFRTKNCRTCALTVKYRRVQVRHRGGVETTALLALITRRQHERETDAAILFN